MGIGSPRCLGTGRQADESDPDWRHPGGVRYEKAKERLAQWNDEEKLG